MFTLIAVVVLNLVLIGFGLPLAMRKVKPNPTYGFHAKRICHDPALWYPVNAFAGKFLAFAGFAGAFFSVFIYARNPSLEARAFGFLAIVIMTGLLLLVLVASFIKEGLIKRSKR